MNFFEHQAKARRRTTWYVFLFMLAVLLIVAAVNVAIAASFSLSSHLFHDYVDNTTGTWPRVPISVVLWTSAVTLCVIGGAMLYRIAGLAGGGGQVARDIGGTLVSGVTRDPKLRQLLNVVEETAIAAGVPVPEVYVLDREHGLNAFAAGFTTSDAAIAVTRGMLDRLTRDELQGVIGHEFSHILNGDMRLNTRLIGVLFGILFIGLAGRLVLRSHVRGRNALPIVALGAALFVIGYAGVFFGQMIQAAISRSRERLADASAVQFTRNPQGLASALKKIAVVGSGFQLPRAAEVSHMLIADRSAGIGSMFSSHPPLLERIRAIEPGFRPEQLNEVSRRMVEVPPPPPPTPREVAASVAALPIAAALLVDTVGQPQDSALHAAADSLAHIPDELRGIAHDSVEAIPLAVAFMLSSDAAERVRQLELARTQLAWGDAIAARADFLADRIARLDATLRLPLFELAFPSLRSRNPEELRSLASVAEAMTQVDGHLTAFEYALTRLLRLQLYEVLAPHARRTQVVAPKLYALRGEAQIVLSVLAREGHEEPAWIRAAYESGVRRLFPMNPPPHLLSVDWAALDRALLRLDLLAPPSKQLLVEALVLTVSHDGHVTLGEYELLRAICGILHCPLPRVVTAAA